MPDYIRKVRLKAKRDELRAILKNTVASHKERLYLVGFLSSVGYSESEINDIIINHNQWANFNEVITKYQISTICYASLRKQ